MNSIRLRVAACFVAALLTWPMPALSATTFTDEAAYLAALTAAGAGTFQEGFEDDATWGVTRDINSLTLASITSQGIRWQANNVANFPATSLSAALTGSHGFFSYLHGVTSGAPFTAQRDGFVGTRIDPGALIGVGGWIRAGVAVGAQIRVVLDGTEYEFSDSTLAGSHRFFGIVEPAGFTTFEFYEPEGRVEDQFDIFADHFTFGLASGGTNQPPVAVNDDYVTDEDVVLNVPTPGVIGNDTDADPADTLSAVLNSPTANGELTLNADGSLTYTPNPDFNGKDIFTYRVNDGTADSNIAAVIITVNSVNDAPVANAGGPYNGTAGVAVLFDGAASTDRDGDTLSYAWDFGDGTVGTGISPNHIYTNGGSFTATLTVGDGELNDVATASVVIAPATSNRPPVAVDDSYTTDEDVSLIIALPGVLGNDTDDDIGDTLTAVLSSGPANGTVVLNGDGSFNYTPDPGFNGIDTFSYVANDGIDDSNVATASIMVKAGSTTGVIDPKLEALLTCVEPTAELKVIIGFSSAVDVRDNNVQALVENAGGTDLAVLWIINSIAATVPAQGISDLAMLPSVDNIRLDETVPLPGPPLGAGSFTTVAQENWDETAVRKVLQIFAYGGAASDSQIKTWSCVDPQTAIREILTFDPVNTRLSPVQDSTANYSGSLEELQALWSSTAADNLTCASKRDRFSETRTRDSGEVVLRNKGLQETWIAAVRTRGLNPLRHRVGFWLANYHMAVNLRDTEPPLIRELYDSAMKRLAQGASFSEVLAEGASSAAIAREYGHRSNTYDNTTGEFHGNDDFAREFHQLFFRINGDSEDPDYHENTTIKHTAWALTGMQLDKVPNAYGTTNPRDWWVAPIDFTDHVDGTGRTILNTTQHFLGDLEILNTIVSGGTARQKLASLAAVALEHPESLDNLPVAIINFLADDNLTHDKMAAIRATWRSLAGTSNDLLQFLRAYAISTTFHRSDTFKYHTAFDRNMTLYNLNTVDNEEAYGNTYSPRNVMRRQGAEVFVPAHDVFGGQTSINAANNPSLFMEAYNRAVDFPNNVAKTQETCRDSNGTALSVWRKDWSRVIPDMNGTWTAAQVGEWLWQRFVGDNAANYTTLERAYVTALLATGFDLGYLADPNDPAATYSAAQLMSEPLRSLVLNNESAVLALDSADIATRREANRRVGMAINFISMTPFMFAAEAVTAPLDNRAPEAHADSATTDENTPVTIQVLDNDLDADGDTLSVVNVDQGLNGAVSTNGADVTYTPDPDFHGVDTFNYSVADGRGGTAVAQVTVTVESSGGGISATSFWSLALVLLLVPFKRRFKSEVK